MAAELLNLQLPQDVFRFAFCLFTRYPRKMKGDHDVILYGKIVNKTVVLQDNPHGFIAEGSQTSLADLGEMYIVHLHVSGGEAVNPA